MRDDGRQREHGVRPLAIVDRAGLAVEQRHAVVSRQGGRPVGGRRGQHLDQRRQRIGPRVGAEPHHPEHDEQTGQRRAGRAEAGVDEVQILEQPAEPDGQRFFTLGLHPADDAGLEAVQIVEADLREPGGLGAQHVSQLFEARSLGFALAAIVQMPLDGNLILDRQLAIVKRRQTPKYLGARQLFHRRLSSRSSLRRA